MDDFRDVHIKDEHIVLDVRPEVCFLGPNAVFESSRIDINISARGLSIVDAKFINCMIRVKRQLNNFRFHKAYFEKCQFRGRFSGCDFGRRIDDDPPGFLYSPEAGIVDCDLSAAKLDFCRFINCDLSTLRLPLWPFFTVRDPEELQEQALKLPWPGKTRIIPESWCDKPPKTVAITYDAQRVCKEEGATESELKAVLAQLPGVIM